MKSLRQKYGLVINSIINKPQRNPVTMNHPLVWWASKKGFVRIISATQQEWTDRGFQYFFN